MHRWLAKNNVWHFDKKILKIFSGSIRNKPNIRIMCISVHVALSSKHTYYLRPQHYNSLPQLGFVFQTTNFNNNNVEYTVYNIKGCMLVIGQYVADGPLK